jgi:hypothetical protein
MSLRDILLTKLEDCFSGQFAAGPFGERLVATFTAVHPRVGDVTVWDDNDEVMIVVGDITHLHIDGSDVDRSGEPAQLDTGFLELDERIAAAIVDWLSNLFGDKILLWCSPTSKGLGGHRHLPLTQDWSLMKPEHATFFWSGPVPNTFSAQ